MKVLIRSVVAALLLSPASVGAQQPKTYFDHIAQAWAVGSLQLQKPLHFREGLVLAYPGHIKDLVRARIGRPRSVLLIHELHSKQEAEPYADNEIIFAPIGLLPKHSFWRDNLPSTPHHHVLGGQRYVFRGDDIAAAKRVAEEYAATLGQEMPDRMINQTSAVVAALSAGNKVIREDGVRWLAAYRTLARDLKAPAITALGGFLRGDWPLADRISVIETLARAGTKEMVPVLRELAASDSELGAAALSALATLGETSDAGQLNGLLDAKTTAVRAYAAREFGRRVGLDGVAKVSEILLSDEDWSVRVAACQGLGEAGDQRGVAPLRKALFRGDGASRAAAMALAHIGGDAAVAALRAGIADAPSEAMIGSVLAIVETRGGCGQDCMKFMMEQHASHPEEAIRDLIGIVLQLDHKHEH